MGDIVAGSLVKCIRPYGSIEPGKMYVVTAIETTWHSGENIRIGIFNSGVEQWYSTSDFVLYKILNEE